MAIQLKPETERLLEEELQRGKFRSPDELIVESICAWREMNDPRQVSPEERREAIERILTSAKKRAVPLRGASLKDLIHEGHRI